MTTNGDSMETTFDPRDYFDQISAARYHLAKVGALDAKRFQLALALAEHQAEADRHMNNLASELTEEELTQARAAFDARYAG